jgi:hypothetical protein
MATRKQVQGREADHAEGPGRREAQRTIAHLPASTRRGLQEQARRGRRRGGKAGRALEDRNREQLYELAKRGISPAARRWGKWDLIRALRKA